MQSVASVLQTSFRIPTQEQMADMDRRAKAQEIAEQRRVYLDRLHRANIPSEFRNANLQELPTVSAWVEKIRAGSARNLIISGKSGTGKTYAACAALNALVDNKTCLFTREIDVYQSVKAARARWEDEAEVIARYTIPEVLVLDDLGKLDYREDSLTLIWQIIDSRYNRGKPIIYTTQYHSSELAEKMSAKGDIATAEAIIDRMRYRDLVVLHGESRRG